VLHASPISFFSILSPEQYWVRSKCGTEEETSVHVLCACEALVLLRHSCIGPFFLDPEDIRKLNIVAIWKFVKGTGLL